MYVLSIGIRIVYVKWARYGLGDLCVATICVSDRKSDTFICTYMVEIILGIPGNSFSLFSSRSFVFVMFNMFFVNLWRREGIFKSQSRRLFTTFVCFNITHFHSHVFELRD